MLNIELPIDLHISGFLNTEKVDIENILSDKETDFCLKQLFISIVFVSRKN